MSCFLQHSIMIRRGFRTWLGGIIPVQWAWRPIHARIRHCAAAAYSLLAAVAYRHCRYSRSRRRAYQRRVSSVAGVVWELSVLRNFDPFGTGLFLAHIHSRQTHAGTLTIVGPYRWLRHPVYSFGIVAIWACPVLTAHRLVFDALFTGWIILGCMLEERDLTAQFGDTYERYRTNGPDVTAVAVPIPERAVQVLRSSRA